MLKPCSKSTTAIATVCGWCGFLSACAPLIAKTLRRYFPLRHRFCLACFVGTLCATAISVQKFAWIMSTSPLNVNPSRKEVWTANFERIKEFYHQHGHLTLPTDDPEYLRMAQWLTYQRHQTKKLDRDQLKRLESINYKSTRVYRKGDEIEWEAKFHKLKNLCGDDPNRTVKDHAIACWLSRQRRLFQNNLLDPVRQQKLSSVGIDLTLKKRQSKVDSKRNQERWQSQYEKLKEYHQAHGNCNVPRNWSNDRSLGIWVFNQRRLYLQASKGNGTMDLTRIQKLEEIGFEWVRKKSHKEETDRQK